MRLIFVCRWFFLWVNEREFFFVTKTYFDGNKMKSSNDLCWSHSKYLSSSMIEVTRNQYAVIVWFIFIFLFSLCCCIVQIKYTIYVHNCICSFFPRVSTELKIIFFQWDITMISNMVNNKFDIKWKLIENGIYLYESIRIVEVFCCRIFKNTWIIGMTKYSVTGGRVN
jgi:hypothetical protein